VRTRAAKVSVRASLPYRISNQQKSGWKVITCRVQSVGRKVGTQVGAEESRVLWQRAPGAVGV